MIERARAHWDKALRFLATARNESDTDVDSAVSRAYYASFHGVSALFALRGQEFAKHAHIRSALHLHLIKTGEWPTPLGSDYDKLLDLRESGDYGVEMEVDFDDAVFAVDAAARILEMVRRSHPDIFTEG